MKNFCLKFVFTALALGFAASGYAQSYLEDPKWGDSPEERTENALIFNMFRDAYNNQNYEEAIPFLQQMMERAPRASANTFVYGINIYKNKAARATSLADKNMYIDSLMLIYDKRVDAFGDDPERGRDYILGLKAVDYRDYRPADRMNVIRYFKDAVDAAGGNVDPDFVNVYFNELTEDYKSDEIEMEQYLGEYDRLESILKKQSDSEAAMKTFEALFISSGAANCDNLEKLFGPRVDANPNDLETIGKAATLLSRGNCRGDFFMKVAELYYNLEPSSNTALVLAAAYEDRNDFEQALKYLNAAYTSESDPELKFNLAIRIAGSELGRNNSSAAATYARQAIEINPDSGLAYYILGQAYAAGANGCSGFNRSAAYWLVYDTLVRARSLMKGDEPIGNIDQQINNYRASFPSNEECFFRDLKEGDGYTVSCGWVSGRTTVRVGR